MSWSVGLDMSHTLMVFTVASFLISTALGQSSLCLQRNTGPSSHLLLLKKSETFIPLDASSAGVSLEVTCLHCEGSDISLMVEILLATNMWKRLSSLLRYFNTEVLSVQKTESSHWKFSSDFNNESTLTAKTAAVNSNQGIVTAFSGVTLALPSGKETRMLLPWFNIQRYV